MVLSFICEELLLTLVSVEAVNHQRHFTAAPSLAEIPALLPLSAINSAVSWQLWSVSSSPV